jgi:hypothetical protein
MTRRILAIVAAFVFSIAGHLLAYVGGGELLMNSQQFMDVPANPLAVVGLVVGLLLIAIAALTIVISSAGVIALGALHIAFSLLAVLVPFNLEFRPPAIQFALGLRGLNQAMGDGVLSNFLLGTGFLTGVVLLVAGIAARGRTLRANPVAILVSIAVSILGFVGIFVAITGGSYIYRAMLQAMSGRVEVVGIGLLLLGSVLLAATVFTVRWSSAGVILLGSVTIVASIAWSLFTRDVFVALANISRDLSNAMIYVGSSGLLALVGVVLIAVGVGASIRVRRRAPAIVTEAPVVPESLAPAAYGTEATPPASV